MTKTPKPIRYACIDPSLLLGESVVRRILAERKHKKEESGKEDASSVIHQSLGFSRGIVQLLSGSGYTSYFIDKPDSGDHSFPENTFDWIGFDESSVMVQTDNSKYESISAKDNEVLTPLKRSLAELPKFRGDLNHSADALFNSMNRLKPALFNLEHKYYTAEKLFSIAATSGLMGYPFKRLNEVLKEILFCQTKMTPGDNNAFNAEGIVNERILKAISVIDEMIEALILRTGNSLKKASPGEYQFVIINPHPFDIDTVSEIEIKAIRKDTINSGPATIKLMDEAGEKVPSQCEKTETSEGAGEIKKIAFRVTVPAGRTKYYSFSFDNNTVGCDEPWPETDLVFKTERSKLVFDRKRGFPSVFEYEGNQLLGIENMSFTIDDQSSEKIYATFKGPVQVIEHGPVRTILESSFIFTNSEIHVRYLIPSHETYFDIEIKVSGKEENKILRWTVPLSYNMNCVGRAVSGITCCKHRNREFVFRDWLGMKNFEGDASLSLCAKGAYSFDIDKNKVRISLLPDTDKHDNTFCFRIYPGYTDDVINRSFNNSDLFNNPVIASLVNTEVSAEHLFRGIILSDASINLQAVKLNENGDLVLRLLNPCKETIRFTIEIPSLSLVEEIEIGSRKLMTLIVEKTSGRLIETDLLERIKT